ncbi:MAG: hypothetical protein AAB533_00120, partial [Patescibacteria group bacterium]
MNDQPIWDEIEIVKYATKSPRSVQSLRGKSFLDKLKASKDCDDYAAKLEEANCFASVRTRRVS